MRAVALVAGVGLCLVVATASALTPSRYAPLAESQFVPLMPASPSGTPQSVAITPSQLPTAKPVPTTRPGPSPIRAYRPAPTARPLRTVLPATHSVKGSAGYYAYVPGGAAAAQRLRDAIGPGWRGKWVTVWYGTRHVVVVLSDYESSKLPGRLIDLNEGSFSQLVGPGWYQRGRVEVRVTW